MEKKVARIRRAKATRAQIRKLGATRLTVHRTCQHLYAQVISPEGKVLAAASTVQKAVGGALKATKNKDAAAAVGKAIAEQSVKAGVSAVAFDRSGFKYHGRIKALADAAREAGLQF
jgi:large subunit ribosomal protein L18